MNTKKLLTIALLLVSSTVGICYSQTQEQETTPDEQQRSFRLDYVVKELTDGEVVNARAFSISIATNTGWGSSIRAGSRVPVPIGGESAEIPYFDLGVNIDSSVPTLREGKLALNVTADITSLAPDTPRIAARAVMRQNRWQANVAVPLGEPTVIFSSDDPSSSGRMQLELTATPIE